MTINHDSPLFTVREAAEYLNMSRSSLYRILKTHNVQTVQLLSGKQYIKKETLDELIAPSNKQHPIKNQYDN